MGDPLGHIDGVRRLETGEAPTVTFPPATGWFTKERVEYFRDLFQMLFFGLAIPYLMMRFFSNPLDTIKVVGKAQVTGGV